MIQIGENIKQIGLSKNLTQQHISDELNLSVGALSNI
jgi:transcriptional regulator with XRE-family HTH domain